MAGGKRIIAALCNNRTLLPDSETPLPFETIHRNRNRHAHTLFGRIGLRRNTATIPKAAPGVAPLTISSVWKAPFPPPWPGSCAAPPAAADPTGKLPRIWPTTPD